MKKIISTLSLAFFAVANTQAANQIVHIEKNIALSYNSGAYTVDNNLGVAEEGSYRMYCNTSLSGRKHTGEIIFYPNVNLNSLSGNNISIDLTNYLSLTKKSFSSRRDCELQQAIFNAQVKKELIIHSSDDFEIIRR